MAEIREVLYQHYKGAKQRRIEKSLGVSRNSIRKYISMATDLGYRGGIEIDELEAIALQVHNKIISTTASNRPNASKKEGSIPFLVDPFMHKFRTLVSQGIIAEKASLF